MVFGVYPGCMGESSHDYSWIQDYEVDFPLSESQSQNTELSKLL